jgi:hypothetical protein
MTGRMILAIAHFSADKDSVEKVILLKHPLYIPVDLRYRKYLSHILLVI